MKLTLELDFKSVLRWVLAVVLVWAAISKIANLHEFYLSILAYRLPLPEVLLRLVAIVLPWLELICGGLLITGTLRYPALLWTAVLFAVFTIVTGQAWARGLNISCGCFKLDFLGDGAMAQFAESVKFAFLRAGLLLWVTVVLLRSDSPRTAVLIPPLPSTGRENH